MNVATSVTPLHDRTWGFHLGHFGGRAFDVRAFRHPNVYCDLRPVHVGHEVLFHKAESPHGDAQHGHHQQHGHPAEVDADADEPAVEREKPSGWPVACGFGRGRSEGNAKVRCYGNGENPAQAERQANHLEQAFQPFARHVLGQGYGCKSQDGDACGPKKRPLGFPDSFFGGQVGIHSQPDFTADAFSDHNGVVHKHSQGDYECSQRDALQG